MFTCINNFGLPSHPPTTLQYRPPLAVANQLTYLTYSHQVLQASPQIIVLANMSGWGVNGSLVTLLPNQPLPPTLPSPPASSSSPGLSYGAVAGIVVGSCVGAALLLLTGGLLLHR